MAEAPRGQVGETESELVVKRRAEPAEGVVVIDLVHPDGKDLPEWSAGAHIDLLLPGGMARQYSLCSSPSQRGLYRIGVLLEPQSRGGSSWIHDSLHEGDQITVRGPRNHFTLSSSKRYQFIGGGIGITPLIPMIEAAEADGAEWSLTYGGRSRTSMAFLEELEPYGDRVTIWPQDDKGLIDLGSLVGEPTEDTLVYCCGPEALLNAVEKTCKRWPKGSLHIERFSAREVPEDNGALDTFEVVCKRSGRTFAIPRDRSIYDVLDEAGLDVMASCQEGTCGTCEVEVLEGEPAHRDSVLDDDEKAANDYMMICVSRSKSEKLVIDL
jgi:ferredoxin-NADP reductase